MKSPEDQLSAAYYTDRPGYKIRFHGRKVCGKLRVHMQLLAGEYDNAVIWPAIFNCKASVLLFQKPKPSFTILESRRFTMEKTGHSLFLFAFDLHLPYFKNGLLLLKIRVVSMQR
eukprot:m.201520 g.201520  ORF g.201520 m.201520 type:complete len:115 (+) comp39599_c0_seq3:1018-1362(+)